MSCLERQDSILRRGLSIPRIDIWMNRPLDSWHHGEHVDPKTWPWWVRCRFTVLDIGKTIELRHKRIEEIGFCHTNACQPDSNPTHFESCAPILYKRIYMYTRRRAFDMDIRITWAS